MAHHLHLMLNTPHPIDSNMFCKNQHVLRYILLCGLGDVSYLCEVIGYKQRHEWDDQHGKIMIQVRTFVHPRRPRVIGLFK